MNWYEMSHDERLQCVLDAIRGMSKDGVAPTARQFALGRPGGMPSNDPMIRDLGMSWAKLVQESGLMSSKTIRKGKRVRWHSHPKSERKEAVYEALREMRSDTGKVPSAKHFDENRPDWMPVHKTIMTQFKMSWTEMQVMAGVGSEDYETELLANNRSIEPSPLVVGEPVTKRFYHWTRRCWVTAELATVR